MLYEITQTYGTSHVLVFGGDFNEDIINTLNNQRSRYILDRFGDLRLATTFHHS
jgi:hypothetical protein